LEITLPYLEITLPYLEITLPYCAIRLDLWFYQKSEVRAIHAYNQKKEEIEKLKNGL
jgi:hypothetical protein